MFNTALATTGIDVVQGFVVADDTIQLSRSVFTAFATTGSLATNDPGAFNTGAGASQADDRVIYNAANGALIYDSNGSAAGGATQIATLSAAAPLST